MCRQGFRYEVSPPFATEIVISAGEVADAPTTVRRLILHVHIDRMTTRMRILLDSLDKIPIRPIRHGVTNWNVVDTRSILSKHHQGHSRNKGNVFEYIFEPE